MKAYKRPVIFCIRTSKTKNHRFRECPPVLKNPVDHQVEIPSILRRRSHQCVIPEAVRANWLVNKYKIIIRLQTFMQLQET